MALLTYQQQQAIKPISPNNQNKFAQFETEVENCQFRDLIGLPLLQDLQTNPESDANKLLLGGDNFTDCNGFIVRHKGLYFVLAYLVYEKYIGESNVADTFTGMVQKVRQDSEQLAEGTIKRLKSAAREIALSELELIKQYLIEVSNPFFMCTNKRKAYNPTISSVRKTNEGFNINENFRR